MKYIFLGLIVLYSFTLAQAQTVRNESLLEKNWKFSKGDFPSAGQADFDDKSWEEVTVPHDWAIYGPFDRKYDLQEVAITQNGESVATVKTGRTGGLPYIGVGWYRKTFDVGSFAKEKNRVTLLFDGAMSEARVYVNGKEAIFWPFGYNSFHCDVTDLLNPDGRNNMLAIRLENKPESSRWYPGAGLYRNVHVIVTGEVHVPVWGTYITTPHVSKEYASVNLKTRIENSNGQDIRIVTEIRDTDNRIVSKKDNTQKINHGKPFEQNLIVNNPRLWSPEDPYL